MPKSKDKDFQSGSKNRMQLYFVYKEKHFKYRDIYRLKAKG